MNRSIDEYRLPVWGSEAPLHLIESVAGDSGFDRVCGLGLSGWV